MMPIPFHGSDKLHPVLLEAFKNQLAADV
jgi:hypothetical protein